jgi:hypothetical protein
MDFGTITARKINTAATIGKLTAIRSAPSELRAINNTSDYSLFRYKVKIPCSAQQGIFMKYNPD